MSLDLLFAALAGRRIFVAWRPVPKAGTAKVDKIPYDPQTGKDSDAQDSTTWMTAEHAAHYAAHGVPVGLVIAEGQGLFCVDLDGALQADNSWSPFALGVLARFPGALVEVSHSGRGLHIFGSCQTLPAHRTRKDGLSLEVYTRRRFIALTGTHMAGDVTGDHTAALAALIAQHLPEALNARDDNWTDGPYAGWRGGGSDEQIINAQLNRAGAHATFGDGASFRDLWTADTDALARAFPDRTGTNAYNRSAADQALANHLAWATGYDCERTQRLMFQSALRRDKWEREKYIRDTILLAVAGKIPAGAPAVDDRTPGLITPSVGAASLSVSTAPPVADSFGSAHLPPECAESAAGVPPPPVNVSRRVLPEPGSFINASQQPDFFAGCIYIEDMHAMLLPDGNVLAQKQFDVHFGGFDYQMRVDGSKPTTSAWECFVDNQMVRHPRAHGVCFDPREPARAELARDGAVFINSWVPVHIPMQSGDASPFVNLLRAQYPLGNDADILLAYFAALVQYKGRKFQWAPLLQGVEGNGKTFFNIALEACIGQRYTHRAKASELDSRFNDIFYAKLLVTVEDVYISEARNSMWETLKPMITSTRMEIEGKGTNKVNRDVCFNFIMNSNHRDGIRKTKNDRRIAPFFGAQQHVADLARSGLTEDYFKKLYRWAEGGGYAIIANFLNTYDIPPQWNPATECVRAPQTSSTDAALAAGRGSIEQEVAEAVSEGRAGFRGGWVSSMAFDNLLGELGKSRFLPRNKRQELLEGMGYLLHEALPEGRVVAPLTDGTRPRLYALANVAEGVKDPAQVAALYAAAQSLGK